MTASNLRQTAIALLDQLSQSKLEAIVRLLSVFAESIPSSEESENLLKQESLEITSGHSTSPEQTVQAESIEPGLMSSQGQETSRQTPALTGNPFPRSGQDKTHPLGQTEAESAHFGLDNLEYDAEAIPIWELAAQLSATVPDEEWAKLPTDLARNFDHYQSQGNDT